MDRKRAELVEQIHKALAAARAAGDAMCEYLLETALAEALAGEKNSAETLQRWNSEPPL